LVIILVIMCGLGAMLTEEITEEDMKNLSSQANYDNLNFTFSDDSNDKNESLFNRGVMKFLDLNAFVVVSLANGALQFGYENPQYNYNLLWRLMFIGAFAYVIPPLVFLGLLIGYGIKNIVILWKKRIKEVKG